MSQAIFQIGDLPLWDQDHSEICARIEKSRAQIKILLKTKNDPFFISRWIEHHIKIVGPENVIVFDNMSDNENVLSVYEKFRHEIQIVKFFGLWFNIHHTYLYKDLYRSLANSCDYFLFLDTDEYLIFTDGVNYCSDRRIVEFVGENPQHRLFPTTCLPNANWRAERFICGTRPADLAEALARGKPLLRTDSIPLGFVNHTFQLAEKVFAPPFKVDLFLLHLSRLHPRQRIGTNMNKLIAAGLIRPNESPIEVAGRADITEDTMAGYVSEIRDCLKAEQANTEEIALGPGCLELSADGAVSYHGDLERNLIERFIVDPRPVYGLVEGGYHLKDVVAGDIGRPDGLGRLYI